MTDDDILRIAAKAAALVLEKMRNNVRCVRCGWIGPEEKLYPSGTIARLTCPNCHDGYHWDRAGTGRWYEDVEITCDPVRGCGDGSVYCDRRVAWLREQGLDYHGKPLNQPVKPRLGILQRWFNRGRS